MLSDEECDALRKRWTGDIGAAAKDVIRLLDDWDERKEGLKIEVETIACAFEELSGTMLEAAASVRSWTKSKSSRD
jgi:hypothetical protein